MRSRYSWGWLTLALGLAACQTPPPAANSEAAPLNDYILVSASATRLLAAANDGANTYLEFGLVVPQGVEIFDQDGAPLAHAASGNLLGVPGLHKALLVRMGNSSSFVTVEPRMGVPPAADLAQGPEILAVREGLQAHRPESQAMQRALASVARREAGATAAPTMSASSERVGRRSLPDLLKQRIPERDQ